jgi:hypothetical protein
LAEAPGDPRLCHYALINLSENQFKAWTVPAATLAYCRLVD